MLTVKKRQISNLSNFTIDVTHYKGLVIREVTNIPEIMINDFGDLVAKFIQKSQEDDATVEMIFRKIDLSIQRDSNKVGLWTFEKEGDFLGYLFMEIDYSEYERVVAFVHNLYLSPKLRRLNVFEALDPIMVRWARKKGASHIRFMTGRSPRAFNKRLPSKWEPYGFVFNRPV